MLKQKNNQNKLREVTKHKIKECQINKDKGAHEMSTCWNEELKQGFIMKKEEEMHMSIEDSDATDREKSLLHAVKWQRIILDEVSCDNILWLEIILLLYFLMK